MRRALPSRRGAFLLLMGALCLIVGTSTYLTETPPEVVHHVFKFAMALMPLQGYAILWWVCGLVAIGDAVITRRGRDSIGFAAAIVAPVVWCLVYVGALFAVDGQYVADTRQIWLNAAVYLVVALAVGIVSGMGDPGTVRKVVEDVEAITRDEVADDES